MKMQVAWHSQNSLQKEQSCRICISPFQNLLQSYSFQDSVVLVLKIDV